MDRLRNLIPTRIAISLLGAACLCALASCKEQGPKSKPVVPRSEGVTRQVVSDRARQASASFCDDSFPADGAEARTFVVPPERPVPDGGGPPATKSGWKWVNLWASWCGPCLEEMPLLSRWNETLNKEGIALQFELWSVDEEEDDLKQALAEHKKIMPGNVHWLRSAEDLPAFLESLAVDKDASIPVHALVDAGGHLRCVRVGAVKETAYGAVRTILGQPSSKGS